MKLLLASLLSVSMLACVDEGVVLSSPDVLVPHPDDGNAPFDAGPDVDDTGAIFDVDDAGAIFDAETGGFNLDANLPEANGE